MDEIVIAEPLMGEADLTVYEQIIQKGKQVYFEVGSALAKIRDGRGYRFTYGTFEEYIERRWGFSVRTGYNLIGASEVSENVQTSAQIGYSQAVSISSLPANEQQGFVDSYDIEAMTQKAVDKAIKEWKLRTEKAEKELLAAKEEVEQAQSLFARDEQQRAEIERLKQIKEIAASTANTEIVVEPPDYAETKRAAQELREDNMKLKRTLDDVRSEKINAQSASSALRELKKQLSDQLASVSFHHDGAIMTFRSLGGNSEAFQMVQEFMKAYERKVKIQLQDWQESTDINGGVEYDDNGRQNRSASASPRTVLSLVSGSGEGNR